MPAWICSTCGVQFTESERPPSECPICLDERQYIGRDGQHWTTLEQLAPDRHNEIWEKEPGLSAVITKPRFAIGQRPLLVRTSEGNVLWDCISFLDDATIEAIEKLGGLAAIAISHPHFYSSMVEWSRAFGGAPIYLHAEDRRWVMRPDPAIVFWEEESRALIGDLTLIRCGGHFAGGTVLHWPAGDSGRGALLTGDILYVAADRRYVSFMYSYPNLIPLPAAAVERIAAALEPYPFNRLYGGFRGSVIESDAKAAVARSAERYVAAIRGEAIR